jgi:predicted deacylase
MRSDPAGLPAFEVGLAAPDLAPWMEGNTGVSGFWRFAGASPGPNLLIMALIHGNEIAGALALDALLREPPALLCGALTAGFANLDAFARFDSAQPTASRFVDEDMNRLWDTHVLDGPGHSSELARARAMRPLVEAADVLLDLHSMLWPSEPLILCGPSARGRALARRIGTPPAIVADHGHASGRRLIDYVRFTDPAQSASAVLVEAGQHWQAATVGAMQRTIGATLAACGMVPAALPGAVPRCAEVTHTVTASTGAFSFVRPFRGGDVVALRDTLIATDGGVEIRTPYDECVLIMPSLYPSRGHTAVRLAKFADWQTAAGVLTHGHTTEPSEDVG